MTDNLSPIIEELRRAYSEIAAVYPSPLPMPVIGVPDKDSRRHSQSWYTPDSWESLSSDILNAFSGEDVGVESKSEIAIAAEALKLPEQDLLLELTHQVVHHINYVYRQKDTACGLNYDGKPIPETRSIEGRAHNRWFYETCKAMGLLSPRWREKEGWTFTPSKELANTLAGIKLDQGVFDLNRKVVIRAPNVRTGSLRLWECPHGQKIRASSDKLRALCLECNQRFMYADKDSSPEQIRMLQEARADWRK